MSKGRVFVLLAIALLGLGLFPVFAQEGGTHTVQSGENLFRIALRYGVDMNELAAVNGITDPTRVFPGQELIIPGLSAPDAGDVIENPLIAATPIVHTVQRGEYLSQIAGLYNVSVEQILTANNITNPNTIYPGQELQIWPADIGLFETDALTAEDATEITTEDAAAIEEAGETVADNTMENVPLILPTPSNVIYTVAPGEHLSQIALRYGVSWTTIAEANDISNPNAIYAGMQLVIPGGSPSAISARIADRVRSITESIEPPGAHWGTGRELVVDLSTQMAYAYEDGELKRSALVSTGLPGTPTVQGEFAVWYKTPAQTMIGPGYYLPNVQWVMYFYAGYGFHGTYWHNNFGNPMSHGCVNMTNEDALWFYNFASLETPVFVQL